MKIFHLQYICTIPADKGSMAYRRHFHLFILIMLAGMETNVYDLEPHLQKNLNLPKHNRFYQAKIDSRYLHSGDMDFGKLPNLYVMTITDFDPFGYDQMIYHIHNVCDEVPKMVYDDGLEFYYFYTKGQKGGSQAVRNLLKYMGESIETNATDEATTALHRCVSYVKISPEVKIAYMEFEQYVYYLQKDAADAATRTAKAQDIMELLEEYGEITESLRDLISSQDIPVLRDWHKLAAKVESIEEFLTIISSS